MHDDIAPIRTALLSVSDKTGIVEFARSLTQRDITILSTGGTARVLKEAGIAVTLVEEHTGFPEMLDGRVKTLHPMIHGGILHRRDDPAHLEAISTHQIKPIDLVCIDLYKFEETIAQEGITLEESVEQIDIGGPSMLRSAAKNFAAVTVISSPTQYARVLDELDAHQGTTLAMRMDLAAAAFERTCAFDAAISTYLRSKQTPNEPFPRTITLHATRHDILRYGENPHQQAALYLDADGSARADVALVAGAEQLHGKSLSYNNLLDAAAALQLAQRLAAHDSSLAGSCVIKHTNPCGCAMASSLDEAMQLAIAGDPLAAYGGIAACSRAIDLPTASRLAAPDRFFEIILAPDFDDDALCVLKGRWKNVRLLKTGPLTNQSDRLDCRFIPGGLLVQTPDRAPATPKGWTHAAGPVPSAELLDAAAVIELAVAALASNAIAIGGPTSDPAGTALFGSGAGQMDRVASCRLATDKAGKRARGAVALSDAFFPFPDGPEILIEAGVAMIVHPGGSKRDEQTFDLCNAKGVTCMTTGIRRFRH